MFRETEQQPEVEAVFEPSRHPLSAIRADHLRDHRCCDFGADARRVHRHERGSSTMRRDIVVNFANTPLGNACALDTSRPALLDYTPRGAMESNIGPLRQHLLARYVAQGISGGPVSRAATQGARSARITWLDTERALHSAVPEGTEARCSTASRNAHGMCRTAAPGSLPSDPTTSSYEIFLEYRNIAGTFESDSVHTTRAA